MDTINKLFLFIQVIFVLVTLNLNEMCLMYFLLHLFISKFMESFLYWSRKLFFIKY